MIRRCLAALIVVLTAGAAAPSATAAPPSKKVSVERVPLADAAPEVPGKGREIRRSKPFAMAALRWNGKNPDLVEVQAQHLDGTWGEWLRLPAVDGQDRGRPGKNQASEAAWLGDSTAIRVRAESDGAPVDAKTVSVLLIDPGTAQAASTAAKPTAISRAEWGADESLRTQCFQQQGVGVEYGDTVKAAIVHHTAGSNDYTAADSARIVRGIYAYHASELQWCDIGYNVLVDKFGQVFEGRYGGLELPVWGAHAQGFNKDTVGVSMLGEFTSVAPSATQLESVAQVLAWKLAGNYRDPLGEVTMVSGYGGSSAKYPLGTAVTLPVIHGHRDVGYTECPGDLAYQELPALRQRVAELMGDWTAGAIYQKWQAAGADAGPLGGAYELEQDAADGGRQTAFARGAKSAYWSPATEASLIEGMIRDKWREHGAEAGALGYPRTDELSTPDGSGRYNHFAGADGSIYWTPWTGAHEIRGLIKAKWAQLGWENGPLGYPRTDELGTPDGVGRYNHFDRSNGSVYWTPGTGAHEIRGAIKDRWAQVGWERSYLGYPTSDEYAVPGGRRSDFQHGYVVWDAATGNVTDRPY
ncbi:N-acetylmuramoyl-L-alanine amidase [Saccharopolyspora elongata]|uniref:N-acetylmuramoyl-L-alanine amidase n=1 Tax=Saccharopolyspora elongata TaxID=2530387 RepID=UPI001F237F49|nr:N-acetylmuramoyl-L-alanine amidase [Saccharopolyspora elongata]